MISSVYINEFTTDTAQHSTAQHTLIRVAKHKHAKLHEIGPDESLAIVGSRGPATIAIAASPKDNKPQQCCKFHRKSAVLLLYHSGSPRIRALKIVKRRQRQRRRRGHVHRLTEAASTRRSAASQNFSKHRPVKRQTHNCQSWDTASWFLAARSLRVHR